MTMNDELSPNTQAVLLLTAPLLMSRSKGSGHILSTSEYGMLACLLHERGREPADLIGPEAGDILRECGDVLDVGRLSQLLGRGFLLAQTLEHWQARTIWVVSRSDAGYPSRFRKRLGKLAPPVLYGCGDTTLLENGGLAVVGSRDVGEELLEYTERVGRLAAEAQCTVISGGARGVDQSAMRGALSEGGTAIGVLSNGLEKDVMNRENRDLLIDRRLVLISPYDPRAGFNVGNAMQRNKIVYALADAGLVVESDYNKGGTWAGAVEQLDKLRMVPVYVRIDGVLGKGLKALLKKGALEWSEPETAGDFPNVTGNELLPPKSEVPIQATLLQVREDSKELYVTHESERTAASVPSAANVFAEGESVADVLFSKVEQLLESIDTPTTESDVAAYLQVSKSQARDWLQRLVQEGKYERPTRRARYVRSEQMSSWFS